MMPGNSSSTNAAPLHANAFCMPVVIADLFRRVDNNVRDLVIDLRESKFYH
jgi:hypothetical protein